MTVRPRATTQHQYINHSLIFVWIGRKKLSEGDVWRDFPCDQVRNPLCRRPRRAKWHRLNADTYRQRGWRRLNGGSNWNGWRCCRQRLLATLPRASALYLTIIADDHRQHGICRGHIDDLTIRAACTVSTVKAAISEAIRLGFLARDEQGALMIVSAEWLAFISESSVDRRRDRYAEDVKRFV